MRNKRKKKKDSPVVTNAPYNIENQLIRYPGDKITREMKPCGDIITRIDTRTKKATHRQYMKKDNTPGKQTLTIMQTEANNEICNNRKELCDKGELIEVLEEAAGGEAVRNADETE